MYLRYERVDKEGNFHTLWDESHKVYRLKNVNDRFDDYSY